MASKKITVKTSKRDEKVAEMLHFGYRALDYKEKGNKTTISFGRDLSADDKTLREIEKEYHKISSPFPTLGVVCLGVGAVLLACYFIFTNVYIQFASLLLAILAFGIGLFLVAVFVFMKAFRKQIVEQLFLKGDRFQGLIRDYPISKNIEPINELSGILKHNIKDIVVKPGK